MYTLVKTYGLPSGVSTAWKEIDGTAIPFNLLFAQNQQLKIQVHESFSGEQQIINLYDHATTLQERSVPITTWLAEVSQAQINLRGKKGTLSIKSTAMYSYDAISVDFLPTLSNSRYHPTNQIPLDEKTDIRLTRADTNYKSFGDNCLFTVGGYVHTHEAGNPVGIYIKNALTAVSKNQNPEIGILDFSRIGTIKCIPNIEDYILAPTSLLPYTDEVWMRLPKKVEKDETVLLVLGGYLHMLDNAYDIMGDNTARINIAYIPLMQRFLTSYKSLDLNALDIEINPELETDDFWKEKLFEEKSMKAYLMHSNTFWVYLKAKSIYSRTIDLPNSGIPGMYFIGEQPQGTLRVDLGELPSFIQTYEKPLWVLKTFNGMRKNLLIDSTDWQSYRNKIVNDTPYLRRPYTQSRGQLITLEQSALVEK